MNIGVVGSGPDGLYLLARLIESARLPKGNKPWLVERSHSKARELRLKGFSVAFSERQWRVKPGAFRVSSGVVEFDLGFVALERFSMESFAAWKKMVAPQGTLIFVGRSFYEKKNLPKLANSHRALAAWLQAPLLEEKFRQIKYLGAMERPEILYSSQDAHLAGGESLDQLLEISGLACVSVKNSTEDLLWTRNACVVASSLVGFLLKKNHAELLNNESAREMMKMVFEEILGVMGAHGLGWALKETSPVEYFWKYLQRHAQSSVFFVEQTAQKNYQIIEDLVFPILRAARRAHLKAPLLQMLFSMARSYGATNGVSLK